MPMDRVEDRTESRAPSALLAAGVAVGIATVMWLFSSRRVASSHPVAESILDFCDSAAAKMDEILKAETTQA